MKTKKKNRRLIVFGVIIIFLIIGIIVLVNTLKNNNPLTIAKARLTYIKQDSTWGDYNEVYPDGAPALARTYQGNLTIISIGKSMYYVATDFLPTEYSKLKDMSSEKINKYYEKNTELIEVALGIESKDDFVELINKLKTLNADTLELDSFYIDTESIKVANAYTKATLHITYKNCEDIAIDMKIKNKISDTSSIIYTLNK
jgi:hypothetical protein